MLAILYHCDINGNLHSPDRVTVAVSFNITANKDYSQSSSQIVKAVHDHLDELEEYYHVKDMKTCNIIIIVAYGYQP